MEARNNRLIHITNRLTNTRIVYVIEHSLRYSALATGVLCR